VTPGRVFKGPGPVLLLLLQLDAGLGQHVDHHAEADLIDVPARLLVCLPDQDERRREPEIVRLAAAEAVL